jgi:hypothetical protein
MRNRPRARLVDVEPPSELDTTSLIAALRQGDLAALAAAFDRWHSRVRMLAATAVGSRGRRRRRAGGLRGPATGRAPIPSEVELETFLLGIAFKRVRRHRRAALRQRRALEQLRTVDRRGPIDPKHETYRSQLGVRLEAALEQLAFPQRVAFVLWNWRSGSTAYHRLTTGTLADTAFVFRSRLNETPG